LRPYSPGGALNALASTPRGSFPPASSAHRLRRGLPGYLILFAPHAFAPQRQNKPSWPPSPLVFLRISTHSTATPGILPTSACLQPRSIPCSPGVEPRAFTVRLTKPPTCALRPIIPNNARTLRITAAAGTELAGASFGGTVIPRAFPPPDLRPTRQRFTLRKASSRTRRRCVSLSAIAQDSPLLPPVGVWAVSQSQCGGPSSQTPYASSAW
jgi:hypothetical protein